MNHWQKLIYVSSVVVLRMLCMERLHYSQWPETGWRVSPPQQALGLLSTGLTTLQRSNRSMRKSALLHLNHNPQHLLHYSGVDAGGTSDQPQSSRVTDDLTWPWAQNPTSVASQSYDLRHRAPDLYPILLDISWILTLFRSVCLKTLWTKCYCISLSLCGYLSLNLCTNWFFHRPPWTAIILFMQFYLSDFN